jgi:hypothetical protein
MRKESQLLVLLATLGITPLCYAGAASTQEDTMAWKRLNELVERQGRQLEEQQRQIEELRKRLGMDSASSEVRHSQPQVAKPAPPPSSAPSDAVKTEQGKQQVVQSKEAVPTQAVGRPPAKPNISQQYKEIEAIFSQQGVLTPKGTLVFEPSMQYSFSSANRVVLNGYTIIPAITIGLIDVRNVNHNTYTPAVTTRYGLTNRLELQLYVPYVFRDDSAAVSSLNVDDSQARVFNADASHLGDVQFGLRYQFNMPAGGGPIFIGGLQAKSDTGKDPFHVSTDASGYATELPTGTGFWSIQPSLTAIMPSDPVVFFGSASYIYNFERSYHGTKWDPGNTIGFNLGMGFSMNENMSFSLGYGHSIIDKTRANGHVLSNSQTTTLGSLLFGASYKLSDRVNLNFSVEAGLTEDAPDVQLTLRVPFSI